MFRIRRAQIDLFARKGQADFVARMAGHIRAQYPDLGATIPELEDWLHEVIAQSIRHSVVNESEVAQLILVLLLFGASAAEHSPWIDPILSDRSLEAVGKMRKLVAEARKRGVQRIDDVDITYTLEGA